MLIPKRRRSDFYTATNKGDCSEWEWGIWIIKHEDFDKFDFSLLNPTNIVPESIVPFTPDEPKMFIIGAFHQYKPIMATGEGLTLLESVGADLPERNGSVSELNGVIVTNIEPDSHDVFKKALIQQRF
ncbi:hypothetical protein K501DRAFT_273773 [Backusella circina FSU 941]|nr:hypothetical protein K501DRAFT_273773 [Backusella circina FSU 941]